MNLKKIAAVIIDIVNSRQLLPYNSSFDFVSKNIAVLNIFYKNYLLADTTSNSGDEFQAVFVSAESAYNYINTLQSMIFPIRIRASIGYGSIFNEDIEDMSSIDISGKAYIYAREAINSIDKSENLRGSNVIIINSHSAHDQIINSLSMASALIKNSRGSSSKFLNMFLELSYPIINTLPISYNSLNELISIHLDNNKKEQFFYKDFEPDSRSKIGFDRVDDAGLRNFIKSVNANNFMCKIEDPILVEEEIPWGFATSLAPAILTTSQNINKHMKTGKIRQTRKINKTITLYLKKVYK